MGSTDQQDLYSIVLPLRTHQVTGGSVCENQWNTVRKYDGRTEFVDPLVDVEEPTAPFEVTAINIKGLYLITPRKNKYLLNFIDHFTKYVEAYAIPDQSAESCARVYATQITTRHGTGSTLIIHQGRSSLTFSKNPAESWESGT